MNIYLDDAQSIILSFGDDFDERTIWEIEQKGWFEGATLQLSDGRRVPLSFWDPVRLAQEVDFNLQRGRIGFAEPALVVIPKVTPEYMKEAVKQLIRSGHFDRIFALSQKI